MIIRGRLFLGDGMTKARTTDQVVGGRIGERRRQMGLSLSEVSIASGLSRSEFEQIEKGDRRSGSDQLSRIALALNTTIAELLSPDV